MADAIVFGKDPRVTRHTAQLNGHTYQYLLGLPPSGEFSATVILLHGWPDLSAGWRHQIPALLALNLRVVAPDLLGYGGTDAPLVPPAPIATYSYKNSAAAIAALAAHLHAPRIVLGGHDWGGALAWRVALWHPELVSHVFSVGTPYTPPARAPVPLEAVVQRVPNFGYQLQLRGAAVEEQVHSRAEVRGFLNAVYGGVGEGGEGGFEPTKGVLFERLGGLGRSRLFSEEMLDFYVDQFARNGLHGPLNWYRISEVNYTDELALPSPVLTVPALFVGMAHDVILVPALSAHMEQLMPNLTRREVPTGHWALVEAPEAVNRILEEWVTEVVLGGKTKL